MQLFVVAAWALLSLAGCPGETGPVYVWVQFNGVDDTVDVEVRPGAEGDAIVGDLTSSSGENVIGTVTITPGSGPVGTEHRVRVDVDDAFEERVTRVDLVATSDERGERVLDMDPDSADAGLWVLDVISVGLDGEVRTDMFRVDLYEAVEETEVSDATTE